MHHAMDHLDVISYVRTQKQTLLDELLSLNQLEDAELKKTKINDVVLKTESLKNYVHQHMPSMIAYDIRVCNEIIKDIESNISKERATHVNKPFKFSFKFASSNQKAKSDTSKQVGDVTDSQLPIAFEENVFGLQNLRNEEKTLTKKETNGKYVMVDSLEGCTVNIYGTPCSLRLVNLNGCTLFTGPISSSVFISNCHGCTFHIASQQLRIHDTTACDIYQHVSSRSIIENSSKLRFGCYQWKYDEIEEDFHKAGLSPTVNNWNQVDDFNCLSQPSPNWTLIENGNG